MGSAHSPVIRCSRSKPIVDRSQSNSPVVRVSYQAMIGVSGWLVFSEQHAGLADAGDRDAADCLGVGHLRRDPPQHREHHLPQAFRVELGAIGPEDPDWRRLGGAGHHRALCREYERTHLAGAGVDAAQQRLIGTHLSYS